MSFLWTPTTIAEPSPNSRFSPAPYARTPLTCRKCRRELVIEAVLWLLLRHEPCSLTTIRNGKPPQTRGAANPRCRRRRRHCGQDVAVAETGSDTSAVLSQRDEGRHARQRTLLGRPLSRSGRPLGRGTGFPRRDYRPACKKAQLQKSASEKPADSAREASFVVLETVIDAEAAAGLPLSLRRCRLSDAGRWDPDFKEVIQLLTNIERESLKHYQDIWRGWQWELAQKQQNSWISSLPGGLGRKKVLENEDIMGTPPRGGQAADESEAVHGTGSGSGGSRKPFLVGKIWRSFVGSVFNTNTLGAGLSRENPDAPPSVTPSATDSPITADNPTGATGTKGNAFSQRFRFRPTNEENATGTLSIGSFPSTIQPLASVARRLLGGRAPSVPLGATGTAVSCTKCQVWINEKAVCYCSLKRECFPCSLSRLYCNGIESAGCEASSVFDKKDNKKERVQTRKCRLSRPRSRSVPTFRRPMEQGRMVIDKVPLTPSHTDPCKRPWVPMRWHLQSHALGHVKGDSAGKRTAMNRIKDKISKRYRVSNRRAEPETRYKMVKESPGIDNVEAATLQSMASGLEERRSLKHRNWSSTSTLGESNMRKENEPTFNEAESDPGAGEMRCRSPECYTRASSLDDDAWNRGTALNANSKTASVRSSEPSDESDVPSFLPSSSMCEQERPFGFKENEVSSWSSSFFLNPLFGRATFEGKRLDDEDAGAGGASSEESAKSPWIGAGGKRFFNAFFFCAPLITPRDVEKVLATVAHDVCIPSFLRILPPTHYITLLHGLNGRARDYRKFREFLLRRYPDIHCFVPDCYGRRAFLGILPLTKILRDYLFVYAPHPALGNPRIPRSPDLLHLALSRGVYSRKVTLSKNNVHFSGGRYAVGPDGSEILASRIFLSFVGHSLGGILARSLIAFNNCNLPRWLNKESSLSSIGLPPSSVPLSTAATRTPVAEVPFVRGFPGYTEAPESALDEISGHPWWGSLPPVPVDRGETPWSLVDVDQPVILLNFATFASPHNGTFEDFLGVQALSYLVPTGRDLMTASQELQRLASPEALLPLTQFQTLSLYGNVSNDFLVGPLTSLLVDPRLKNDEERGKCSGAQSTVESPAKSGETCHTPEKLSGIRSRTVVTSAAERNARSDVSMPLTVSPNNPVAPAESMEFPLCVRATCIRYDRVPIEIDPSGYVIESPASEQVLPNEETVCPSPKKQGERSSKPNAEADRVLHMGIEDRSLISPPDAALDISTRPLVLEPIQARETACARQRGTASPTPSSRCAVANCIHQQLSKRHTVDGVPLSSVNQERELLDDRRLAAARAEHKASFIWLTSFSNAFLQVPPRPYPLRRHHHGVRGNKHSLRKCDFQGSPHPSTPSTPQHFNFSLIKRFHRDTKYLPSVLKATFPLSWTTASDASSSSSPILSSDISETSVASVVYPASCPESPSSSGSGTIFRAPSFAVAVETPQASQQRNKTDAVSPLRHESLRSAAREDITEAASTGPRKEQLTRCSASSQAAGRRVAAAPRDELAVTVQSPNLLQHPCSSEPAFPSAPPAAAQTAALQQTSVSPLSYVRHLSRLPWRRFGVYIPSTFFAHNCIIWHSRLDLNDLGHPVVDHFLNSVFVHCAPTWCCDDLSAGYRRAFTPSSSSLTITTDLRPNAESWTAAV